MPFDPEHSYFEYNGRRSNEFGLRITNDMTRYLPERNINTVDVDGMDGGDLSMDMGNYKSYTQPFPVVIYKIKSYLTMQDQIRDIMGWLTSGGVGYKQLFASMYPDAYWQGLFYERTDIADTLRWLNRATINFKVKPLRHVLTEDSEVFQNVTNSKQIENPYYQPSSPILRITGTGDIDFYLSQPSDASTNQLFQAKLTGQTIIIDTQNLQVTDQNGANVPGIYTIPRLFLYPGITQFKWSGTITKLEVMPRWVIL